MDSGRCPLPGWNVRDRTVPVGRASLPAAVFMSATVKGCRYSAGNRGTALHICGGQSGRGQRDLRSVVFLFASRFFKHIMYFGLYWHIECSRKTRYADQSR
jgi:hypothetical protein